MLRHKLNTSLGKIDGVKYSRKLLMTERSHTMPVIGRLDDQVEAILINPLKRRRPATDAEGRDELPAPPSSDEDVAAEPPDDAPPAGRTRAEASLPVWML
jgi:hypothetical protein